MQAQTQMAKGELLLEIHGKTVTRTVKEISPNGVKLQMNDEGQTTGKYNAGHIETVTVLIKPDGTNEWETKAIETTKEGDFIAITGKGTGHSTSATAATWQGDVHFMTMSPKLSWLNNTRGWVEGTGDMAAGTFHGKVYAKK